MLELYQRRKEADFYHCSWFTAFIKFFSSSLSIQKYPLTKKQTNKQTNKQTKQACVSAVMYEGQF